MTVTRLALVPNDSALVTEPDLIARVVAGDRLAARALYDAHVGRVHRLAYRLTGDQQLAEEVVQDTFVRAIAHLERFRGDCALATWLHRITVTVALNARRGSRRREERETTIDEADGDASTGLHGDGVDPILRDRLWFFHAGRYEDESLGRNLFAPVSTPYTRETLRRRFEGKGTYSPFDGHTARVMYLNNYSRSVNSNFQNELDLDSLTDREDPESTWSLNYTATLSSRLFVEGGYATTTLVEVADHAGVAARTVYLHFATKAELLRRCIGTAIVGDTTAVPLADRAWMTAAMTAPTLHGGIRQMAAITAQLMNRAGGLLDVARQASAIEPEIAGAAQAGRAETRRTLHEFWHRAAADGLLHG